MRTYTPKQAAFMQRAIELARLGEGRVEPNPMVGCIIVRAGQVAGEGWHRKYGGPHAEVHALRAAGARARGATAYVTLEPCCHVGKTPPCADALIAAGVKRVVAAVKDPNPVVSGRGLARLRRAGLRVEVGLLAAEARELLAPFITVHTRARPYVILKWAQSMDGCIATRAGDSKWITSRASRAAGHALRARVDAILVGIGTVLADDPALTARMARPRRIATRVVLDRHLRTPLTSRLVHTARERPTIIACGRGGPRAPGDGRARADRLRAAGCEVLELPAGADEVDIAALLAELHARGMTNVMVEGGGRVLGSFFDLGLADEAHVFVAPKLIGGAEAPGPLGGIGPATMADLAGVRVLEVTPFGPDLRYRLRLKA